MSKQFQTQKAITKESKVLISSGVFARSRDRFPSFERDHLTRGFLDTTTHLFTESGFKHDFSNVPVQTAKVPLIQAKPMVGEPGDTHEQEADRVASKVVKPTTDEDKQKPPRVRARLITTTAEEEEKKKLIAKQKVQQAQEKKQQAEKEKATAEEKVIEADRKKKEEGKIQKQAQPGQTPIITPVVQNRLKANQSGGQPLAEPTRVLMESRFHHDFSKVKVHNDPQAAQSLNARAFTHRNNIVFNAGQYQPEVPTGQHLLAHELTHVVQQGAAPVKSIYESN